MDAVTAYGLFAITFMLVCYLCEERASGWTLAFAVGCLLSSGYGFLQGAWPFGVVELIWAGAAARNWRRRVRALDQDRALQPAPASASGAASFRLVGNQPSQELDP